MSSLPGAFLAIAITSATVLPATGHSIDHHLMGAALDLGQLAFAQSCMALRGQAAPVA